MEHARGAGDLHGAGRHRGDLRVWLVLSRRARVSSRSRAHPDADVFEALRGRTHDDIPDPHARPVLVHTAGADFATGGVRHANAGDSDWGLWVVHETSRLGLGTVRLGLCSGLGTRE